MKTVTVHKRRRRESQAERSRLYKQFSPAYELFFPLIIRRRIHNTIKSMGLKPGQRVLEIGVGTGVSLDAYPAGVEVVGVDLSSEMLRLARKKVQQKELSNIELMEMNAENLEFEDEQFDAVLAFHVVSVVSNPRKMMSEMVRVCRPGGELVLINHFRSERRWVAKVVDRADGVTRKLGWRTNLACDDVVQKFPLQVRRRYKSNPLSLFTIVKATREDVCEEQERQPVAI